MLPLVSSAPVFIAQSRGFFAAEGLEIELRFFQAAQPVALAVASGDVEFGVTGLTAGFYNLAGRGALAIIAGQARVEPGDEFIAYVAGAKAWQAGLRTLDALPGHAVGITQTGSTFHYMVGRLADKRGFALEKVRLVTLETVPNVIAALRGGRIDAALLPGHLARPLVDEGIAKLLGWAGDETPWQLGAVFTTPRALERRGPTVERFLRAYRRGAAVYDDVLRPVRAGSDSRGRRQRSRARSRRGAPPFHPVVGRGDPRQRADDRSRRPPRARRRARAGGLVPAPRHGGPLGRGGGLAGAISSGPRAGPVSELSALARRGRRC